MIKINNLKIANDIMKQMEEIEYGWLDKNNIINKEFGKYFSDNYILQAPKEVMKNKIGICWDQVELERYYFKNTSYEFKTYFIVYYDNNNCPSHTFLTFKNDNKYYWFEHSYEIFRGIHEYKTLKDLLLDVRNKFIKDNLDKNYNKERLCLHEYDEPQYHISVADFYKHCDYGKYIDLDNI